jgi:hypothetical protein
LAERRLGVTTGREVEELPGKTIAFDARRRMPQVVVQVGSRMCAGARPDGQSGPLSTR